jgi:hypothetical protein
VPAALFKSAYGTLTHNQTAQMASSLLIFVDWETPMCARIGRGVSPVGGKITWTRSRLVGEVVLAGIPLVWFGRFSFLIRENQRRYASSQIEPKFLRGSPQILAKRLPSHRFR